MPGQNATPPSSRPAIARITIGLFAASLLIAGTARAAIPTSERNALIDLYNSTNGASWTTKTNWLGAAGTECTWYGVTCFGDHVTDVDLDSNNLTGSLPASIQNLTNLGSLSLFGNNLSGSLTPAIGNLPQLYHLMLASNQLSGPIPPELGNLSSSFFSYLYLYSNQFTGGVPSTLQNLTAIRYLWLDGNDLSGTIPSWLGTLPNLQSLSLSSNGFTGSIPPELGNLVNVEDLSLSFNQLTGTIPASLGSLTKLKYLYLYGNQLTGSIPPQLANMTALLRLELYGNQLAGSIPPELGSMPSLQILNLMDNRLSGTIPSSLGNLTTLTQLQLQRNDFSGQIPASLGNLTGLATLWLSGNMLAGPIPDSLAAIAGVTSMNLGYNALYASGAAKAWADAKQPGWDTTQTVAPSNVAVASTTETTASLTWTPIAYTANTGRYEVSFTPGGSTPLTTSNKSATGLTVTGLAPGTAYTFTVRTVTDPIGFQNHNTVVSDPSPGVPGTTTQPLTPAQVIVESNPAPMFAASGSTASTQLTLVNTGGAETTVQLLRDSGFFTISPTQLTLGPGARASATISSTLQPLGAYSGAVLLSGTGVPSGLTAPVTLIVYGEPGADVPNVVPTRIRIDVTGPGRLLHGSVSFVNQGAAATTGVVVADAAWLIPDNRPLQIPAGATREVQFDVNRDFRADPSSTDSASTTVRFVYPPVSGAKSRTASASSSGSQAGTNVVDTPPLTFDVSVLPPISAGQVGFTIPAIRSITISDLRLLADLVITNTYTDRNLGLYLLDLGAGPSNAARAGAPTVGPDTPLHLADPVGAGFDHPSTTGSIHFRSQLSSTLFAETMLQAIDDTRRLLAWRDLPTGRSDFGAGPGATIYLPGTAALSASGATLWVQEVAGASATFVVDLLDAAGTTISSLPAREVAQFELSSQSLPPLDRVATLAIRHTGGTGRITAICEEGSSELDARSLWDPRGIYGAGRGETLVIPWASSDTASACPSDALCLLGGQFQLTLDARDQRTGNTAEGVPEPENDLFGFYTLPGLTGSSDNPEVFVKMLDGRGVNGHFWTFYGGLTDLEYDLRVTDTTSGSTTTYHKKPGTSQGGFDTGSGVPDETCPPTYAFFSDLPASTEPNALLSLQNGRFRIELTAEDPRTGADGRGWAIRRNETFGYFSIPDLTNNPDNPEVFVKVLDGGPVNGRYWVFFGSLTDFGLRLTVTDLSTGLQRTYLRGGGSACGGFDTSTFPSSTRKTGDLESGPGPETSASGETTTLALFSPTGATVELELRTPTRTATSRVELNLRETRVWDDVFAELFSGSAPESGAILIRPLSGEVSAAAWRRATGPTGVGVVTTLPIVPTRRAIARGGEHRFHGVQDASTASIGRIATAVTPSLALVETSGNTATVEIRTTWAQAGNTQGNIGIKRVTLAARQFLQIDDIVRFVSGSARDTAADLYDVTVTVRVFDGNGKVVPVLVSRAISSGDCSLRVGGRAAAP